MATQAQILASLQAQLQLLSPSFSDNAESPEQLILQTVSAALANAEVNLNTISSALDINSKTGDNLDRFLALFGFARQTATQATGYVTLSTNTTPAQDIVIPANTQIYATLTGTAATGSTTSTVFFITQYQGTIPANSSPAQVVVPIIAVTAGSSGNVPANSITSFAGASIPYGVSAVTNANATTGGTDAESDAEFSTRFTNTVFRNLAGTESQYLALVAASQNSTQANVIGPQSRYQEYIQVPPVDDYSSYEFINASGIPTYLYGAGVSGQYTTALSTVPYSQYIWTDVPNFVTNGQQGADAVFYREGIDWILNTTPSSKNVGDAYRFWQAQLPGAPNPASTAFPTINQPNVTFINVYPYGDSDIEAVQPEQVVFFEHTYTSAASRNNPLAGVTQCIDIYVDGSNDVPATTITSYNPLLEFVADPFTYLYNQNYQRFGEPQSYPVIGNTYLPFYQQPVDSVPAFLTINGVNTSGVYTTTFYSGPGGGATNQNYWFVQDISPLYGTVRARNGIEFSIGEAGYTDTGLQNQTGLALSQYQPGTQITIGGYTYDNNIVTLQGQIEQAKQITTDVLVHQAFTRYFKLDITVVYAAGSTPGSVNAAIQSAVLAYFAQQTFGSLIQVGSILQAIFAAPGVQNVRWSADLPFGPTKGDNRIVETDYLGNPLWLTLVPTALDPLIFNDDFFLADDQLATLAPNALPTDTLPGIIIRARAENSFVRGPYNPLLGPGGIPIEPPD
jgi:uncharacterized phage protein gp47/JayE